MLLVKEQAGVWLDLDGREQNCRDSRHQNQGAGKGQKLASGTASGKGSWKATGTAESLVGTEAEEQKAAGSVSKEYGLGWLQSKDSRYRTGLQSCPLHHKAVFHNHLLGGWLLNINLVGSVLGLAGKQWLSACKRTCPRITVSHYTI